VPHQLGQQQAVERLNSFLEKVQQRYKDQVSEMEGTWVGNVLSFAFKTYGFKIKGNAAVEQDQVKLDGDLPLAAMMFKGRIEQSIRDELEKLLA
jgi:hypothetical protein